MPQDDRVAAAPVRRPAPFRRGPLLRERDAGKALQVRDVESSPEPEWKSTGASGAPDNSSLSHFSAMTWPRWLRRAVRNRHRHAIEQASRRWRGGRRGDSGRTHRKFGFHTGDEELRPYFALPNVLSGLFGLCSRIFDVRIEEAKGDAPVWHPDVQFFKVLELLGQIF